MAILISTDGKQQSVAHPLTLTALQRLVGGPPDFVDLLSGDTLVVKQGSWNVEPVNLKASSLAGLKSPVYGNAVFCSVEEIA